MWTNGLQTRHPHFGDNVFVGLNPPIFITSVCPAKPLDLMCNDSRLNGWITSNPFNSSYVGRVAFG